MNSAEPRWMQFEGSRFEERSLSRIWLLAAATYGVGDIVTTIALVYFVPYLTEANQVIRITIETLGGGGFLALKLIVFYVTLWVSLWAGKDAGDPVLFYGPPVVLTAVGLWTTVHNLSLLL